MKISILKDVIIVPESANFKVNARIHINHIIKVLLDTDVKVDPEELTEIIEIDANLNTEKCNYFYFNTIYESIKKQSKILEQPCNMFIASFCMISKEDRYKAEIIQARIILAMAFLEKLTGYEDIIKRALNSTRILFSDKKFHRLFVALPDFSLDIPLILEELKSLNNKRTTGKHHLNSIISILDKYSRGSLKYTPRKVRRKKGVFRNTLTTDIKKTDFVIFRDEDEQDVRSFEICSAKNDAEAEIAIDSRSQKRFFEVHLIAPMEVKRSLSLQNKLAKSSINQILRREKQLSTDFRQLTHYDVNCLVKYCLENLDVSDIYTYLLSVLFLGKHIEELLNHNDSLKISNAGPFSNQAVWVFEPPLPRHSVPKGLEKNFNIPCGAVVTALPDFLTNRLKTLKSHSVKQTKIIDELKFVIKVINKASFTRLSLPRIANYMSYYFTRSGHDASEIALLRGKGLHQEPGCSYYQVSVNKLYKLHASYISELLVNTKFKDRYIVKQSSERVVGSFLQVKIDALAELFLFLRKELTTFRTNKWADIERFHQHYTLYIILMLKVATGHRPVNHVFDCLDCFDLNAKTIFISDKESRSNLSARVLSLPDITILQLEYYLEYLSSIRGYFENFEPETGHKIEQALLSKGPLFFFISDGQYLDVTPGTVLDCLKNIFPVRLNWNRHFMRTWLREQEVDGSLVDAWMGHVGLSGEGYSRYSGLSLSDMRAIATLINSELFNALNLNAEGFE